MLDLIYHDRMERGGQEDWARQVWGDALWAAGRAAEEDRVPHPPTGDLYRSRLWRAQVRRFQRGRLELAAPWPCM